MGTQNSKLNPETLDDLKNATEFNEEEIKDWYQGFLIDYPQGCITVEQFADIYRNFYPDGDGRSFAEHTFRVFDYNGDGKICFREFLTALSVTSRGDIEKKLNWVYSIYDLDGNGYISRDEMLVIVKAIFKMVNGLSQTEIDESKAEARVDQIYGKLDKDADGRLSLSEFIEGAKNDKSLSNFLCNDMSI